MNLPTMHVVRDERPSVNRVDPYSATRDAVHMLSPSTRVKRGARVAITAGSRGISNIPEILRGAVDALKQIGADPFIFPAMGSHGGGTAEGQRTMLEHLGITPKTVGAEIVSQMDVVEYAQAAHVPVYLDKAAAEADAILIVGRVKPHTDFNGRIESGLCKMAAIGLGKAIGAKAYHAAFARYGYEPIIREVAETHFNKLNIVAGVAVVEDHNGATHAIEAFEPAQIIAGEERLLELARGLMSRLPFNELDLLIVDEMGKNISGTGMDTNVTGRGVDGRSKKAPDSPTVREIFVRALTTASDGNANGIGLADFCTRKLVDAIDWRATYLNALTAAQPAAARLPVVCETDADAITHALAAVGIADPSEARIARVRNTLHMETILASDAAIAQIAPSNGERRYAVGEAIQGLVLDDKGMLPPMPIIVDQRGATAAAKGSASSR